MSEAILAKPCAFDGCDKPARYKATGLCSGHHAQQFRGHPLVPLFSERRRPGSPVDPPSRKCSRCDKPAAKMRNQTYFCTPHYRMKQMRDDAKIDGKLVPSWEMLAELFLAIAALGLKCPACHRAMNWLKEEGVATIVTLQHDRDGGVRLLCLGCNSRHQHYPADTFYEVPPGHKRCNRCGTVKQFGDFYRDKYNSNGLRSDCKECAKSVAIERQKRKREHARVQRGAGQ